VKFSSKGGRNGWFVGCWSFFHIIVVCLIFNYIAHWIIAH
jgi:hypothetical protein